ncbi:MAG TPA: type V CRISPR-associated protein Cas12a/Cpf1 [Candidatus Absconditabacterales bacterium]|nr:type V CRISPR-associated protein Cas12a/Cpf1 [Candidatus Absconditabacterales bacterium]
MTNLYSLNKTLRFELKPVGNTRELIESKDFFKNDEEKAENYQFMKEKMDKIHRNYIQKSLETIKMLPILDQTEQKRLKKEDIKNELKSLRSFISAAFVSVKDLLSNKIIEGLISEASIEEKEKIKKFDKFFGYFKTYVQNRGNLYKAEDKAGQIAFRLIDENLPRFFKAKQIIEEIIKKTPDFVVKERNEKQEETEKKITEYLSIFYLNSYCHYLSQSGIDLFNEIVGHINLSINLYKQKTGVKFSLIPLLYKLPLAPRKQISRLPKQIENPEELELIVKSVLDRIDQKINPFINNILQTVLEENSVYDLNGIYISIKTTEQWGSIGLSGRNSLRELGYNQSKNGEEPVLKAEKNKFPFISLGEIKSFLDAKQLAGDDIKSVFGEGKSQSLMNGSWSNIFFHLIGKEISSLIEKYLHSRKNYQISQSKENQKHVLDNSLSLWRLLGGFVLMHKKTHLTPEIKESFFYDGENGLDAIVFDENSDPIHTIYDKVRNCLTKKPYSNKDKIKVNFDCPYLLGGWDQNYDAFGGLIFHDGKKYFLGLIKGSGLNMEEKNKLYEGINPMNSITKIIYDYQKPDFKNVPRLFIRSKGDTFAPMVREYGLPVNDILYLYDNELYKPDKKNPGKHKSYLRRLIDYFKLGLSKHKSFKHYIFKRKESDQYENLAEFYSDVEFSCYAIKKEKVNFDQVKALCESERLYLFEIYNKDYNQFSKGKNKNLHTQYFEALFEERDNNLFMLSGGGSIFWRESNGKIVEKIRSYSPKYNIEIIDKRRYTKNKLMIHIPIVLNFCRNQEGRVNDMIKSLIQSQSNNFTILGIDRGEKHLLYYSLIRQDGTIIKTGSRNTITNKIKIVDYHKKLDDREKKRDEAQANWEQQEQIKDLKKGYISQVINEISKMIIEHNAIIVLEDLNGGFKRGRQKVEKSIYQQFELALAKKLNHLVFKNRGDTESGGTMKAYQLTPLVAQFQDLSFQTGVVFYTPAGYTSTTCPCCGWRKNIYFKYENEKQAKIELEKLNIVRENNYFSITYTAEGGNKKGKITGSVLNKTDRILTTKGQTRLQYDRASKNTKEYDITTDFNSVFTAKFLDYKIRLENAGSKQCRNLINSINLLLKIRNAKSGTDIDTIQCPACEFHSQGGFQGNEFNGDANGAYNIARKGKVIIDKIVKGEKNTTVSQIEFDNEIQK